MTSILPPILVTFAPAWWRRYYGVDFSEQNMRDPVARTKLECAQRRQLFERFGDVGLGERDPQPHPVVDGAYGHRFMAALWGCEITYAPDHAPAAVVLDDPATKMVALHLPDLAQSPVARKFREDAAILTRRYGACERGINIGGPLNSAVSVLGQEILAACVADPDLAGRVLTQMARLCLQVDDELVHDGAPAGLRVRPSGTIGNCPVCMISPETYRRVVLPVDQWYRDHYAAFSIHHCGVFHPYRFVYQLLRPNHLDIGWGSDLRLIRAAYPNVPVSLEIQAGSLAQSYFDHVITSPAQLTAIDDMINRLVEDAAPMELITHLWVAEAGPEVSDDVIRHLVTWPMRQAKRFETGSDHERNNH